MLKKLNREYCSEKAKNIASQNATVEVVQILGTLLIAGILYTIGKINKGGCACECRCDAHMAAAQGYGNNAIAMARN